MAARVVKMDDDNIKAKVMIITGDADCRSRIFSYRA